MTTSMKLDDVPLILQEVKEKRKCFTVGSIVNYINSLLLLAVFFSCIIVIGTVGSIQDNLKSYTDPEQEGTGNSSIKPRHACYMFANCKGEAVDNTSYCYFRPKETNECEAAMIGYSFIALAAFIFFVVVLINAILNLRISWSVVIETLTIVILILLGFSLSVMISIGNLVTCSSIKNFYNAEDCDQKFPYKHFNYYSLAGTARDSSWSVFIILLILLVVYIIRLVIFLKRRKKSRVRMVQGIIDSKEASSNTYNQL